MSIARDVIVVGVAEDETEALRRLLQGLPAASPAALLVVAQMPLDVRRLDRLLAGRSTLSLGFAYEGQTLGQRHVHLAPPGTQLVARPSGLIGLELLGLHRAQHGAMDRLLVSAAAVWGHRVIAVQLSGCKGLDTHGLMTVEQANGISIVQTPDNVRVRNLPADAITANKPLYVAPVDGIVGLVSLLAQD